MKDFRGMKRQRNRNRKPSSGNQNNPNRAYESNGPEGTKVRGNAQTIYEKYQQLARDANSSGDRVLAENHLQHAEHYFRMIRQMQPQRPVSEFVQRDPFASPFDDFDEDMEIEAAEPEPEAAGDDQPQADDGQPQRFDRNDRNRNDSRPRDTRGNGNGNGGNGYRNEPRSFEPRPEGEGNRMNGERRETRRERYERRRAERLAEQEVNLNGASTPQPAAFIASTEPLGGRTGRPPLPLTEAAPPVMEAPAAEAPALQPREPAPDTSHLPAFLSRPAPVAAAETPETADEAPVKPKRAYTRKPKASAGAE